ncbi:MAG: hypothetical protein V1735_08040 [Nanoarchaeota archaeon]
MDTSMPTKIFTPNLSPNRGGMPDDAERASMISPQGRLDLGSLLRLLDWQTAMFAGRQLPKGVSPITVNVEGGYVKASLELDNDYAINFVITRSGGSSLEVQADILSSPQTGPTTYVTSFFFSYVTIDQDGRPVKQAPDLAPGSEQEKRLYEESMDRKKASLTRRDAYRQASRSPIPVEILENQVTSESTRHPLLNSAPQCDFNPYGIIFGGQIMKNMFDHGWNATRVALERLTGKYLPLPLVAAVNHVTFDMPVRPGDPLHYDAAAVFSSEHSLVERVVLSTSDLQLGESKQTNSALFTFTPVDTEGRRIDLVKAILPSRECDALAHEEAVRNRKRHKATEGRMPALHDTTLRLLQYR